MGKNELTRITYYFAAMAIIGTLFIIIFKGCEKKSNPTIERLESINDSLYNIIALNNEKTQSLFAKIDSLRVESDTIIEKQDIINKIYRNDTYTILNSSPAAADSQFRATLKKSDSLLKAGFYSRTYDLRPTTIQSKLQ
jgi:hypothetical protein